MPQNQKLNTKVNKNFYLPNMEFLSNSSNNYKNNHQEWEQFCYTARDEKQSITQVPSTGGNKSSGVGGKNHLNAKVQN